MANVVIKAEPLILNLSPYGFHRYSKQFFETACEIKKNDGFNPVPYYLYCRAIELGLKSFLLVKKTSVKELKSKKLGHNLCNILLKSKELGLEQYIDINKQHIRELEKANKYYESKGFEYFQVVKAATGYQELPDLKILFEFARLLVKKLEKPCWQETNGNTA